MRRTANRPLPARRMDRQTALHFGVGLSVFSVILMGLATNYLAAALLAVSILFYVLVYTVWLKRRTAQNIVIGGAAGAFPPLIGWVAATGQMAPLPLLLFAIIFLWTPPHFWALSLFVRSDYAAAKVPMLPVIAGHCRDPPADLPLQPADGRRGDRALAAWARRAALRRHRQLASARSSSPWPRWSSPTGRQSPRRCARRSGCSAISVLYLFVLVRRAGRRSLGGL